MTELIPIIATSLALAAIAAVIAVIMYIGYKQRKDK